MSRIKYDRKQNLKIINDCSPEKIPFDQALKNLQLKILLKPSLFDNPKNQRRSASFPEKSPSEMNTILSNLTTLKNDSDNQILLINKKKSSTFNKFNPNDSSKTSCKMPLSPIQEVININQENGKNIPNKKRRRISDNNYILYDINCVKKVSFKDGLNNLIKTEQRKSINNILNDKKLKYLSSEKISFDVNNSSQNYVKVNTKLNYENSNKHNSNNISREDDFQKIKKQYFSPFVFSNQFPNVSLRNKILMSYLNQNKNGEEKNINNINNINRNNNPKFKETKTNDSKNLQSEDKKFDENVQNNNKTFAISRNNISKKSRNEKDLEEETNECIKKTENVSNPLDLSGYIHNIKIDVSFNNKDDYLNQSINRFYDSLINSIDNKINDINFSRNSSYNKNNKKNSLANSSSNKNLRNTIDTMNSYYNNNKDYFESILNSNNHNKFSRLKNNNRYNLLNKFKYSNLGGVTKSVNIDNRIKKKNKYMFL